MESILRVLFFTFRHPTENAELKTESDTIIHQCVFGAVPSIVCRHCAIAL